MQIIKPSVPVRKMLEENGYPFKSKKHSLEVDKYQRLGGERDVIKRYIGTCTTKPNWTGENSCPKILLYQFTDENKLRISDACCKYMKEKPLKKWMKENGKKIMISGIMRSEGGRRSNAVCVLVRGGKVAAFQPMAVVTKEWEDWFIKRFDVELCELYGEPYNFERTGCKGCPFARHLQRELDTMDRLIPQERRACETIWKPVYDEYRRIGYRLRKEEPKEEEFVFEGQMTIYDFLKGEIT